MRWKRV